MTTDAERSKAIRRVLVVTFWLNVGVAAAKIAYGAAANVLAIRADGFHSLTDSANNVVGLLALRIASRPADADHHYGHRKVEVIASTVVGVSLLVMAADVARSAVGRLTGDPELPRVGAAAFVILGVTLIVNFAVAAYERSKGRELDSTFLISDAQHTRSDALVTVSVMIAMALVAVGHPEFDVVAAAGVAGFIAYAGIQVLRKNLGYLADQAPVEANEIERIVRAVPGVAGCHKIRTRGLPGAVHVDLHIQIAPHLNVVDAHRITHLAIDAIKAGIRGATDVVIHTEPARPGEPYNPLPVDWGRGGTRGE